LAGIKEVKIINERNNEKAKNNENERTNESNERKGNNERKGKRKFKVNMGKIKEFKEMNACNFPGFYVNVGNPHFIMKWNDVEIVNVKEIGKAIRYCNQFKNGTNAHFIQKIKNNEYKIRSYERGVEDETLACGTGICSSAYAMFKKFNERKFLFHARGGDVKIDINENEEIFMTGDASYIFEGNIEI